MMIPTEPIGSIPRSARLLDAMAAAADAKVTPSNLETLVDEAVRDTVGAFEATGSPVITDGEQGKPSFATYPVHGMTSLRGDGVTIPFKDGHTRQLPALTAGPFRYRTYAATYLARAKKYAHRPVKQAVVSASALSLLYPQAVLPGYTRESFIEDLVREARTDIRRCIDGGADSVQIDFTEARLSIKLDPSKKLLKTFIDLNNRVLDGFSAAERQKIGVHTCPGGDRDSTHSADVDYAALLPELFQLDVGRFYVQLASEPDPQRVLRILGQHARPGRTIFVGVTDPIDARVETPEVVRDRILAAAKLIAPPLLGSTDDCGFSPFADDTSTSREVAFAKIRARVQGNALASKALGV
jgi:5-methyltetrahydropteroyltriglutamate--homocysteine methyltransferase